MCCPLPELKQTRHSARKESAMNLSLRLKKELIPPSLGSNWFKCVTASARPRVGTAIVPSPASVRCARETRETRYEQDLQLQEVVPAQRGSRSERLRWLDL